MPDGSGETSTVLFVCTANQCRSPMAEVLAATDFAERGLPVVAASAGELPGGVHATKKARKVMAARGLDLSAHVSRQLDAGIVASSTLILTMERRHLGAIAALDLSAIGRSFPFAEFVRTAPPRPLQQPLDEWIARVHALRDPRRTLTVDTADDIADPMGESMRRFRRCADTLADHVAALGRALGGPQQTDR